MIFTSVTVLLLTAGSGVLGSTRTQLGVLGGHDCATAEVVSCKDQFAAELVVDGKVVATIPLDAVPQADRQQLIDALRNIGKK